MPRIAGFTLIELVMVLAIASLLSVIALPAVLSAMRNAGVNRCVSTIERLAGEARMRSLMAAPAAAAGQAPAFGVVITQEGGRYVAALVRGAPGDGAADDRARIVPESRRELPASVEVAIDGQPLRDRPSDWIAWYYRPVTGSPMVMAGGTWSPGVACVGFAPALPLTDLWGITGYDVSLDLVAGGGFEATTRDGGYRQAIRVLPSGSLVVREPVAP